MVTVVSGPPPTPTSPTPPSVPPPPYYPYPPYGTWYPPPQRDNLPLILIILVVALILVPVVLGAILYVMVAGLIGAPTTVPTVLLLGPVSQADGNATISVGPASVLLAPSACRIYLEANGTSSPMVTIPPPDESVPVSWADYDLRVFWLDRNHDGSVGAGDAFRVAGNAAALPTATDFEFTLRYEHGAGSGESSAYWTT